MKNERESTTAEKITAAAAVASAAAQTKIAVEAAKTRREMEEMHAAMEVAAERQERIQLGMAAEQMETNFRNTVLAALPLLKTEEDRTQFLTEQFVPKLKNTEDEIVLFPLESLILSVEKNKTIYDYLESESGKELRVFLAEGKQLADRQATYANQKEELEETQETLRRQESNFFGVTGFVKIGFLWAVLFLTIFLILKISGI